MKQIGIFFLFSLILSCTQNNKNIVSHIETIPQFRFNADSSAEVTGAIFDKVSIKNTSDFTLYVIDSLNEVLVGSLSEKVQEISQWSRSLTRNGYQELNFKTTTSINSVDKKDISNWSLYVDILSAKPLKDSTFFRLNSYVEESDVNRESICVWHGKIVIKRDLYLQLFSTFFHF